MNAIQRAATVRKGIYLAAILGLFTLALFWRGKLSVPADWLARRTVLAQAERMELRELDQGDPEIAGSVARLSLIGFRGAVVTGLWTAAIQKQRRNEFHEFELLARLVTRLQPNFETPWVFQSWNIAYNVSVENDKLGDMYFYIARGIELLAEGDRLNTKIYRDPDGGGTKEVGLPYIRHSIGFYYQNKFGVSDKVNTLRSLMQLSCIPPAERDPKAFRRADGTLDADTFRKFCEKNPQLVRRLKEGVQVTADPSGRDKRSYSTRELVVQFLDDNFAVPTRYTADKELKPAAEQFPILPPKFPEGEDEAHPLSPTDDSFDAFLAARAWFAYGLTVVPPPKADAQGRAVPWATPQPGEYDAFKYRVPRQPAMIVFRQESPRAQAYLAERLMKEGWFDAETRWTPDARSDQSNQWFPKASAGDPDVSLKATDNAQTQWAAAFTRWKAHGEANGLTLTPTELLNYQTLARAVPGDPGSLPPDISAEQMKVLNITQENVDARKALVYYAQNRSITNFAYFLAQAEAEADPVTVAARKTLFDAEQAKLNAENTAAVRKYAEGLALWREALVKYKEFHRGERSDKTEEDTFEYELELTKLLRQDGDVRRKAEQTAQAAMALMPALGVQAAADGDYLGAVAEREAGLRVAALDARVKERAERLAQASGALFAGLTEAARPVAARAVVEAEFDWLRTYKTKNTDDPWVRESTKDTVRTRLGLVRRVEVPAPPAPGEPGGPPAEGAGPQ